MGAIGANHLIAVDQFGGFHLADDVGDAVDVELLAIDFKIAAHVLFGFKGRNPLTGDHVVRQADAVQPTLNIACQKRSADPIQNGLKQMQALLIFRRAAQQRITVLFLHPVREHLPIRTPQGRVADVYFPRIVASPVQAEAREEWGQNVPAICLDTGRMITRDVICAHELRCITNAGVFGHVKCLQLLDKTIEQSIEILVRFADNEAIHSLDFVRICDVFGIARRISRQQRVRCTVEDVLVNPAGVCHAITPVR
mmetsp:Transcript_18489/g.30181  ORF Transcript_18489/g.30181 Transcript_18489/m.30181 type:complete len:254 (+) Transcript_18489:3854-4615(+)